MVLSLPFFIFFVSCSPKNQYWKFRTINADFPYSSYSKAYLATCHPFDGLEVELLFNGFDSILFLNTLILCFPESTDGSGMIEVKINIEDRSYIFLADRFEGGQRIKLPENAKQLIIASLLDGRCPQIIVDRYHAILQSDNFRRIYNRLH